jgi:hypothetical protein
MEMGEGGILFWSEREIYGNIMGLARKKTFHPEMRLGPGSRKVWNMVDGGARVRLW